MLENDTQMDAEREDTLAFSRAARVSVIAVSMQIEETSRKNHTQILRGLMRVKQTELAKALGVNDSTITRWKDEGSGADGNALARTAKMLAILGFKLVPVEAKCFMELED